MKHKLLLFDLDGTLLKSDKTISENTLRVIGECRKRGLLIGVSTSRSEKNSMTYVAKLCPDAIISSGGALVKFKDAYIYKSEFSKEDTENMIWLIRAVCGKDVEITVDTMSGHYWNYKINPKQIDQHWSGSIYTDFSDFSEPSLKVCVEISNPEWADKLRQELKACDCIRFSDGDWYKFTKRAVTKENAISELCRAAGISAEEIIAFGDDYADIGMLKFCGLGIAMGNAIDEVKEIADQVIAANDEDGIAEYLERRLLLNPWCNEI